MTETYPHEVAVVRRLDGTETHVCGRCGITTLHQPPPTPCASHPHYHRLPSDPITATTIPPDDRQLPQP